ncbi:hypothetical protein BC939DRAFT_45635 [Gamsiella multidivaricata]|uniref:uncharacterized protein n=1 Tax=Gamsiella multidivaricata TaxID=101098 RepID=UPI002220C4BD|nr:uncharacterized protein BC939DRAFT_45635 [Gamsiella multidivaricata]KAI7816410.1 hypothetical protein BC939DRAFT_45635 [Gamsiella multidivaricata]
MTAHICRSNSLLMMSYDASASRTNRDAETSEPLDSSSILEMGVRHCMHRHAYSWECSATPGEYLGNARRWAQESSMILSPPQKSSQNYYNTSLNFKTLSQEAYTDVKPSANASSDTAQLVKEPWESCPWSQLAVLVLMSMLSMSTLVELSTESSALLIPTLLLLDLKTVRSKYGGSPAEKTTLNLAIERSGGVFFTNRAEGAEIFWNSK